MLDIDTDPSSFSNFFITEISKEHVVTLDFSYLEPVISLWWRNENKDLDFYILKVNLSKIILEKIKPEHRLLFTELGLASLHIAAVCIKNLFHDDTPILSLIVHETFSELFHLNDIKYKYEEHKTLFLKKNAIEYRDWGSGYGEITPHSDDLYENLDVDYLSLTVCRDLTKTPTLFFLPKEIFLHFTDDEIFKLKNMQVEFTSGKNVDVVIRKKRNIMDFTQKFGFRFFLDFRVDNLTGQRMQAYYDDDKKIVNKMREIVSSMPSIAATPETGSFLIVANHKVLHARSKMNIAPDVAEKYSNSADVYTTPRLLYRSKGQRKEYLSV